MLTYLILGATYAFAAAVQPGQFQAYLVAQSVAHGWRRTLPAAFAPVLSDLPIICLVVIVLTRVPPEFVHALQFVGGLYLLYLAWRAFGNWREYQHAAAASPEAAHRTLFQAALVNTLNPNPYLAWALVLGPLLLHAWAASAGDAAAFVLTFYVTMAAGNAVIILLFSMTRALGPAVAHTLLAVSAAVLACFGVFQIWVGAAALLITRP